MTSFLALLVFLRTAGLHVEPVTVPGADNVALNAVLVSPSTPSVTAPAIVALHGCGGPFPKRDGPWAAALANAGHLVLLPDSFGSRGLGSQCGVSGRARTITPDGARRLDAIAAARWLAARPGTPAGGVALMGWSNGGSTVLATARAAPDLPAGLFRRFAAFYPGCAATTRDATCRPVAPIMILMGENDDWTPAPPCHALTARFPDRITMIAYPGAYHDFDAENRPVTLRSGAASTVTGVVHTGTNEPARRDAFARVPPWLEATPAGH